MNDSGEHRDLPAVPEGDVGAIDDDHIETPDPPQPTDEAIDGPDLSALGIADTSSDAAPIDDIAAVESSTAPPTLPLPLAKDNSLGPPDSDLGATNSSAGDDDELGLPDPTDDVSAIPPPAPAETAPETATMEPEEAKPPPAPAADDEELGHPDDGEKLPAKPTEEPAEDDDLGPPPEAEVAPSGGAAEVESAPDSEGPLVDNEPSHTKEKQPQFAPPVESEPIPDEGQAAAVSDVDEEEEEHGREDLPPEADLGESGRFPFQSQELRKVHERFLATSGKDIGEIRDSARVKAEQSYEAVRNTFAVRVEAEQYAPRSLLTHNAEIIERMQMEKRTADEIREMVDKIKVRIEEVDGEIDELRQQIAEAEKARADDEA